ncbi:MAG: family 16 glycoside hydrolase [Verrucomicrobiales bacterium]
MAAHQGQAGDFDPRHQGTARRGACDLLEAVSKLVAAARTGDPVKGKATFHSATFGCAACHKVGDTGGIIGPDLSALGSGVAPERIVMEVLWPGQQVKEGFSLSRLTLNEGSVLQGYSQQSRDRKKLLLRDFATGQTREIPTGEIRKREDIDSLMPPTAQNLPEAELVPLLAWLISLRGTEDQAFEPMFDGKTLAGWEALPATTLNDWVVRDGIIAGTGSQNRQSFLVWNEVRVVAKGRSFQYFIYGKPASEFTDHAEVGHLDSGGIALQIHDKGMKVEFKDLQLRKLAGDQEPGRIK